VDTSRMVVIGHSAGARTAALATADDRVVGVALLAGVPQELAANRPALMVVFENDAVIDPANIWSLHLSLDNSIFVNIAGTGHAAPLDACPLIQDRGGLTELREALGEAIVRLGEDGCLPKDTDARAVQDLLRIYITGFTHEVLGLSAGPVGLTAEVADLVAGVELQGFNEPPPLQDPTATQAPAPTTTQAPATTTAAPATTTTTTTTTPSTTTTTTTPPAVVVNISGFAYSGAAQASVGQTIRFTNMDGAAHTASAAGNAFDTGTLSGGQSADVVIDQPGTYTYFCWFHGGMTGTITVTD